MQQNTLSIPALKSAYVTPEITTISNNQNPNLYMSQPTSKANLTT
jgi:hypothetical protein